MKNLKNRDLWRWARWGLLLTSLVTGGALCFAVWASYQSVQRITNQVAHGEGYALLHQVRQLLSSHKGELHSKDLGRVLEQLQAGGLTYIGVFRPRGRNIASAGKALGHTSFPIRRNDLLQKSTRWGKRLRMMTIGVLRKAQGKTRRNRRRNRRNRMRLQMRKQGRWHGPMTQEENRWRWQKQWLRSKRRARFRRMLRAFRRTDALIIEFEPKAAALAQREAQRTLWAGGLAAFALLVVTAFFWIVLHRLSRLEKQRQEEQQLALLGEMSAVMAHEIRNPLTSLKGHAQLLQESLEEGTKQYLKAERVVEEAKRLENLSSQLLDFVKQGNLHLQWLSPVEFLQDLLESTPGWKDAVQVDTTQAPTTWCFDPTRISQVMRNLIANALQASPPGVAIDATIAHERSQLTITIRDRGEGIPTALLDKIFAPFYTTKTRGTGLGLAVAKRLIDLHNGSIIATNHPHGGASFTISLPQQPQAPERPKDE